MEIIKDSTQQSHEELRVAADEAYRKDDYPEAIRLYSAALASLERTVPKDNASKIRMLTWLALAYQHTKDFEMARRFHEAELRIARQLRDREKIASALHGLGDAFIELKDDRRAERCLSESLKLFQKFLPNSREIPHLLYDLADIAIRRKDSRRAECHYRAWIAIQQSRRDANLPRAWYRLGSLAGIQKNWQTAENHFNTALSVAQELGSPLWESFALKGLGRVAIYRKQYDRADSLFSQALPLAEPTKYLPLISTIHFHWGNTASYKGDFATACQRYIQAIQIDNEAEAWSDVLASFRNLAAAQFRRNKPGFAAFSFAMMDSIKAKYKVRHYSGFEDYYRKKCRKEVSEETWKQALERARTMSISDALAYLSEE